MSNTQSKSVLQRAVGGIFLLALIALIAVLLLQPSDKLPNTASHNNITQKPTLSISANDPQKNQTPEIQGPALVLESATTSDPQNMPNNGNTEIISEDLWQSVEQNATQKNNIPSQITDEAIVIANVDTPVKAPTSNVTPPKTNNAQATPLTKPQEKPKTIDKPKTEAPKLELISNTSNTPKPAAQQNSKSLATGKWYVQLGAFSNSANAQKLVTEFTQKGYNVRIQKDKQLNRVQIGPYATKKEAEQVQSRTKGGSLNPSIFQAK